MLHYISSAFVPKGLVAKMPLYGLDEVYLVCLEDEQTFIDEMRAVGHEPIKLTRPSVVALMKKEMLDSSPIIYPRSWRD